MENEKKFESKADIVWSIIIFSIIALADLWYNIFLCLMDVDEFDKYIKEYISTAKGTSMRSSGIVAVFYSNFGRTGCLLFLLFCNAIIFHVSFGYLNTLRRYLRKEKLYKMGLVSDMDDDEKPQGLIKRMRLLFSKKKTSSSFARVYSRKELRKMKRELKELEKKQRNR